MSRQLPPAVAIRRTTAIRVKLRCFQPKTNARLIARVKVFWRMPRNHASNSRRRALMPRYFERISSLLPGLAALSHSHFEVDLLRNEHPGSSCALSWLRFCSSHPLSRVLNGTCPRAGFVRPTDVPASESCDHVCHRSFHQAGKNLLDFPTQYRRLNSARESTERPP